MKYLDSILWNQAILTNTVTNMDNIASNHIQEKTVLLVSSVYLEPENLATTAGSACILLLANRLTQDGLIPRALLHRPERITTIEANCNRR